MTLGNPGTKRKAPADGIANPEQKVPSNKRSRHLPSDHAENAKRQCSGTRRTPYCPEPLVADVRGGHQSNGAKEPDAKKKAPLLDKGSVAAVDDEEEESEDDGSADSGSRFDDEEDEQKDGEYEPYETDAVPKRTSLTAGVGQAASGLEGNQTSEQNDDAEEDESEEEPEEESITSSDEDYWSDIPALEAHRERQWERERHRLVAELEACICKLHKGAEEAAAELSTSQGTRPIAAPPDDTGISGRWILYNQDYLAHRYHNHRLYLRTSTPEKPVYDSNWTDGHGIAFEITIESGFPDVKFSCEGLLPLTTSFPDSATLEPVRIVGKDALETGTASIGNQEVAIEHFFMDIVFLGEGYLKLYLPVDFLKNSEMRKQSIEATGPDDGIGEDSMVEFIGSKELPRHLRPRPKTPPSPKESYGGWLAGYNS